MGDMMIADAYSRENAHKIGFLVNEYPGKDIKEIASLCQMSALDFNVAVWRAVDMGFLTLDKKGKTTFHELPGKWIFGEGVDRLVQAIPYAIAKLAEEKGDIEENYLTNWASNGESKVHDVLIAMRWLLNEGTVKSYKIENITVEKASKKGKKRGKKDKEIKDVYTFYTLPNNLKHHWGLKQFKDKSRVSVVEN